MVEHSWLDQTTSTGSGLDDDLHGGFDDERTVTKAVGRRSHRSGPEPRLVRGSGSHYDFSRDARHHVMAPGVVRYLLENLIPH